MLFAQVAGGGAGGGGAAGPTDAEAAGALAGMMVCYGLIFVVAIVVQIFFLLTLSRALQACDPRNRTMEPGQVWLSFIPLAGIVFLIMALFKVPDSLANEYRDRGIRTGDDDFGKNMAIWYIVTAFVCGFISPIFFIMYWVKIAGYVKELQGRPGRAEYDDDDRDDRPARRRRDDDRDDRDDGEERPRRSKWDDEGDDDRPSRRRRDDDDDR